ncbi:MULTISPECIES: apolipoprotein N-acyltransferase [unclassified Pedobacter]|uniref:apolipoprotein N-acyltransferase n=1 Tax=unclassified Pedobacter TaxID=2628915 RepID=UPI001D97CAFC|nr:MULTISPECIES: apolipoprotein N-acyltransferase [unclassified Pedobacter]CAH0161339.1 Apolipoprotein N-acyltransferase [Pedobacter sp. Bi36]CAH0217141.1 Apolipoprotein N-acyltransferase [Pedobacter sp. Bi126]
MKSKQTYLLALLSAFLLWLAWPPMPFTTPLLLIGLVPLFIALNSISGNAEKKQGKRIFLTAGLTFLVWNTASIYWVYNAISAYNGPAVALPVSLIPYGLGALLMTFAFWLYYRLGKYVNKKIAYLGLIAFYIALEYLQQTWDLAFPWMTLGNGLAGMHQLAQWYDFTGVYGGSLWILVSNILAFEAYKKFKSQTGYLRLRTGGIWALVVIIPISISLTKYFTAEQKGTPSNVVVVQPNIDPYQKLENIPPAEQIRILTHLSDSIGQTNTEYFIWPETAIPNYANEDRIRSNPDFINLQSFLAKYKNGTLITGIESIKIYPDKKTITAKFDNQKGLYFDNFNTAMQVENSANVQFYHKSKLVPGVEKMPFPKVFSFLDGVFAQLGGTVGGWGWQEKPSVLYAQSGIGAAPVVCYESLWGDWIGQQVKDGAQFIAIITNDGWWGNTSGKDQHEMYAKLRAIETHRDVARSANTGISCFINQRGDITQSTEWWTRTAIKANINLNDEITFYVKSGDIIAKILSALAIVLALIIPYRKWVKK